MKGFALACVIFVCICGVVILNCIWLGGTVDKMISASTEIPESPSDAEDSVKKLSDFWYSKQKIIALTVNHSEVEAIDELIVTLDAYRRADDGAGFTATAAALREALDFLKRSESFSPEGIF